MSHPFPGLFAGRRKNYDAARRRDSVDEDSMSSVSGSGAGQQGRSVGLETTRDQNQNQNQNQSPGRGKAIENSDLVTGKCGTCDSLVRWPRELLVFRCTVCLMINDLRPVALEARRGDGGRVVKSGKGERVQPLSVERTRELVEKCVVEYLCRRLRHDDGDGDAATIEEDEKIREKDIAGTQPSPVLGTPIIAAMMEVDGYGSRPGRKDNARRDGTADSEVRASADISKDGQPRQTRTETPRGIFAPLEDYIITSLGTLECVNNSFSTSRSSTTLRTPSDENGKNRAPPQDEKLTPTSETLSELDAKTLLLGDFAENGSWWTGGRSGGASSFERLRVSRNPEASNDVSVTLKSPQINWADVNEWYYLVLNTGRSWQQKLDELISFESSHERRPPLSDQELDEIEAQMIESQSRTQRVLLKAAESLLKRPGRLLQDPNDLRWLLILLANPLLYPSHSSSKSSRSRSRSRERKISQELNVNRPKHRRTSPVPTSNAGRGSSGRHSGIIKRIMGLLSNLPNECHHHLVSWLGRYSDGQFQRTTDLIGSFVTYRLTRQNGQKREVDQDPTAGLIPSMSSNGRTTSAALHAALGSSSGQSSKKNDGKPQAVLYNDDWQIRAAARVMALFFSANNSGLRRRGSTRALVTPETGQSAGLAARERAYNHGQILPTSDFYNTLLDYSDLIADFEAWESRRGKFTFCQYPFFLSIWAKIQIMEHDARRQMEVKAREAFFDSIMTHKNVNQYLVLKIRRDCLVEDSLKGVSEVVGSGDEEIKKGLRIEFKGEEGIDAGGLRKEWFLLLVRDVFNPEHGMYLPR